ncbi:zona pellucida sperm-binding protein 4-like [Rhinatrema bivittatum]|uniref:zona pellucida sperm-binding protein 4-like n=1 Tax=Rhinatrema bivittatum TaxID=194408 RepID=UPI001127A173|nr:zona pellucida sperm-binding protein 4-like [Rhinatrema bivittatum]
MGGVLWHLAAVSVLLVYYVSKVVGVLDGLGASLNQLRLTCGDKDLQFKLPWPLIEAASLQLTVLSKDGKLHALHNDPDCGTSVFQTPNGSVSVSSTYTGCYVYEKNNEYVMTVGIAGRDSAREWTLIEKELRCLIQPVLDAPRPSQCANIQKVNRLSCADLSLTQDQCQKRNCCYDASDRVHPCFFGNEVTAQCTQDGQFSIAISKDVTLPSLNLSSVRLARGKSGCGPVAQTNAFLLFKFPLSACGTLSQIYGDQVLYENEIVADKIVQTWKGVSLTRDSTFRLNIQCVFAASSVLPLKVEVFTLGPPPPISSQGPLMLEMRIATDVQYNVYYGDADYPVTKLLRDPVFVEVRILQREDPKVVLMLHQCWATPATNPLHKKQWPILVNGCPFTGDNYLTQLLEVQHARLTFPSHYKRFIVKTFAFVDSTSQQALSGQVYFHCSASACTPSTTESCSTICSQRRKRSNNLSLDQPRRSLVTADGPVDFHSTVDQQTLQEDSHETSLSVHLEYASGIVIAVGILSLIVVLLELWKNHKQIKPSNT